MYFVVSSRKSPGGNHYVALFGVASLRKRPVGPLICSRYNLDFQPSKTLTRAETVNSETEEQAVTQLQTANSKQ